MIEPAELLSLTLSVLVWGLTGIFIAATAFWVYEVGVLGRRRSRQKPEHGFDNIQVRILTINAERVVQETVDSLPDGLTDRHVIAEEPLSIKGATVHVVPDEFDCEAVRKGRAIEWARRELSSDKELVLYLDEDSLVSRFRGLPDADIVQIRERPQRTGSLLTYLADVYRVGVQLEQCAFGSLNIPLYGWGGGIAVRESLEDEITWDRESLVEDTAFVWRAARRADADFALAEAVFENQAPPSFREILEQRRRWAAGNHQEAAVLPRRYRWLVRGRNAVWGVSPFAPFVLLGVSLFGVPVVFVDLLFVVSTVLSAVTAGWFILGLGKYDHNNGLILAVLPLLPFASLVHSMGTIVGLVDPPARFRVTKKLPAKTERDPHQPTAPRHETSD